MANFLQKYVHLNIAGYNEAIFQIVMAKCCFTTTHKPGKHPWSDGTVFDKHTFKMASNMAA